MGFLDPWDMQNLLQLYQQLNLAYYTTSLHSFCQNNFGPQKSNTTHFFSKTCMYYIQTFFLDTLFFVRLYVLSKCPSADPQYKYYKMIHRYFSFSQNNFRRPKVLNEIFESLQCDVLQCNL